MSKKTKSIIGNVIISPSAKPLTNDLIAHVFFGMSFDQAVKAAKENKDGKYDDLYVKDGKYRA